VTRDVFTVLGLDHINVTTPRELESEVVEWYEAALGLDPIPKPQGTRPAGAWFRAGEHEVHVSIDHHQTTGTAHFGIVVDDFDAAVSRLQECGSEIVAAGAIPGRRRIYTRDPAHNRIEIVAFDKSHARASER
jgi:catechol 2,3-dioxygenase-like lactoylglutathione lyase family enzyme